MQDPTTLLGANKPHQNDESNPIKPSFKYSITQHRAKVSSLKSTLKSADVHCKEILITLRKDSSLPIRIYRPKTENKTLPTFFYIPGTAYVAWETEFTDMICSHIAEKANCQVISIYHRLAPENKFPAGLNDSYQIMRNLIKLSPEILKIDPNNVAVGGYSSGGNIAALMAIEGRKANLPIKYQALISPIVDLSRTLGNLTKFKGLREYETQDLTISEEFVNWFLDLYIPEGMERKNPRISPFWQKKSNFRHLPPTDFFFGKYDHFRIDSEAYADELKKQNVMVESLVFEQSDHSFLWYKLEVVEAIAKRLTLVFNNSSIPLSPSEKHRLSFIESSNNQLNEENESDLKAKL